MNLVVDTSVIIAVIANEPEKADLIARTMGADLLAPRSVHWEIGNAFSAMLKRGRVTLAQVKLALDAYRQIPITLVDVELDQAMDLASQTGVYAYDAYVIACAKNQKCELLTLDRGLIHAATQSAVKAITVTR